MSKVILKISRELYDRVVSDLLRPHSYARERVGFLFSRSKKVLNGDYLVYLTEYKPVDDEDYIDDQNFGSKFGSRPINDSISYGLEKNMGVFHVHMHELSGRSPEFSKIDLKHLPPIFQSCHRIIKNQVHGMLLLGGKGLNAHVWIPEKTSYIKVDQISIIGSPMLVVFPKRPLSRLKLNRYNRQSFLGPFSEALFKRVRIGIVGLSGGGSHIVQQLSHIGFKNFSLFDNDVIDETNLNRLVGAELKDLKKGSSKFYIAKRTIRKLQSKPLILGGKMKWEELPEALQLCDVVFGCVDSLATRRDLESECRRYMIPYIDIGMGIDRSPSSPPYIFGQAHVSIPGESCLICRGFLNQEDLATEAKNYGEKGGRPQVVWPNGVLASTAVGGLIDLLTNWTEDKKTNLHITYDGNTFESRPSLQTKGYPNKCPHYSLLEAGPLIL